MPDFLPGFLGSVSYKGGRDMSDMYGYVNSVKVGHVAVYSGSYSFGYGSIAIFIPYF